MTRNGKGFVLTFSVFVIIFVIVLFAIFYSGKSARSERDIYANFAIEKAGFVADDVVSDFNRLLGTAVDANRGQSFTTIWFRDKMPADINKLQLIDLNEFIDGNYSEQQGATINLAIDNLIDGNTELVFSNGLRYDYNYGLVNTINLYNPGADSGVITYDINITVNDFSVFKQAWAWDPGGDINVNLRFRDQNSQSWITTSGKLDSSLENTYRWDYNATVGEGDSFYVKVGSIGGSSKALQLIESLSDTISQAKVFIKAEIVSPAGELKWYYDADLNYSQKDLNINRKIELGRA